MKYLPSPKSLLLCMLVVAAISAAGCNVIWPIASKLTPPPKTPAKYKLGADPVVVLVENYRNPATSEVDADQLAALIAGDLRRNQAAVLVDDQALQRVKDANRGSFRQMSIPAVGRAARAKQVLYVNIQDLSVETDIAGQMVRGKIAVLVRVVDAATGETRWPTDTQEGWPIAFETPFTPIKPGMTESNLRRSLHDQAALNTVRLFRDWVPEYESTD